jgi:hypothetical protein
MFVEIVELRRCWRQKKKQKTREGKKIRGVRAEIYMLPRWKHKDLSLKKNKKKSQKK